jgi:hypothetical protein
MHTFSMPRWRMRRVADVSAGAPSIITRTRISVQATRLLPRRCDMFASRCTRPTCTGAKWRLRAHRT